MISWDREAWAPPVEGVKDVMHLRTDGQRQAAVQAAGVLQDRYVRWLRWHYSRILASMRRDLEALDHIPDDAEALAILNSYRMDQMQALNRLYLSIYPSAVSMVMPEQTSKAYRIGTEAKELSPEQQRILAFIEEHLGISISSITMTTMETIETIRAASSSTEDFIVKLQSTGAFSPARATAIAVTETNSAVNSSIRMAAQEAAGEREMVKEWHTSHRTNVRQSHREMDEVRIPFDDFYRVRNRRGGEDLMLHPGDRAHGAGPENFMNCKCVSIPEVVRRRFSNCPL